MVNAVEPESYVRPHRHLRPDKVEVFLCLRGRGALVTFDDGGAIQDVAILSADGDCWGAEVPPGTWHTLVSLEPGSVFYEVIEGPYDPDSHKKFAPWAPGEEEGQAYLEHLRERILRR